MNRISIIKDYNKIRDKYKDLPELTKIEEDLNFKFFEVKRDLVMDLISEICFSLNIAKSKFETISFPPQEGVMNIKAGFFSKEDKNKIGAYLLDLELLWENISESIFQDEKARVEVLKKAYKTALEYKKIMPEIYYSKTKKGLEGLKEESSNKKFKKEPSNEL